MNDLDIDSEEFEKEVNELMEWSENLDFEAYVKDWYYLSTSESSANFVPKFINSEDYNILI